MNATSVEQRRQSVVSKYGPWTASNIQIADHLYTIDESIHGDEIKLRRVVQVVSDTTRRPLKSLRVLDLACHEGIYAIEFARHGANAVGIEGREAHIEKARFIKDVLALGNLEIFQDDVRNLSRAKYGTFDVVLCLGILYHLDVPDVFRFLEQIGDVCQSVAVIDTRISLGSVLPYVHEGIRYWGNRISEGHAPDDRAAEKMKRYWASLDNLTSFHLTRTSLFSMLSRVGFTSVYECYIPPEAEKPIDRVTFVAIKGYPQRIMNNPLMEAYPTSYSPEEYALSKIERLYGIMYRASKLIPQKVRVFMKTRGALGKLYRPFKGQYRSK